MQVTIAHPVGDEQVLVEPAQLDLGLAAVPRHEHRALGRGALAALVRGPASELAEVLLMEL
ncbi:hypothetical protein WME96_09935 [Sorangium sp. So ce406]